MTEPTRADGAGLHRSEVDAGERFEFGENWARFLRRLDSDRIALAETSLKSMLGVPTLSGMSFLDAGAGSGLFSLAARRLGARVVSFDYDPKSVACERELKRRFHADDPDWQIFEGSILDSGMLSTLGSFDVVYSWGVLHHTGRMWTAIDNVCRLVNDGGALFIAIYNDEGAASIRWRQVKRLYNRLPRWLRPVLVLGCGAYLAIERVMSTMLLPAVPAGPPVPRVRGMSLWYDLIDWVGGYPFEVAKPEEVFRFARDRGFELAELTTCGGKLGCNEFVFRRRRSAS